MEVMYYMWYSKNSQRNALTIIIVKGQSKLPILVAIQSSDSVGDFEGRFLVSRLI